MTNVFNHETANTWPNQTKWVSVPFSVYIHNVMFVFILEWVFWKEPWYGCDFTT